MKERVIFGLSVIWELATSVAVTLILSFPLFWVSIRVDRLAVLTGLSNNRLMANFIVLMTYLLNPFSSRLIMPDFPSSLSGLQHFSQVKNLFSLVLVLVLLLLPAFILSIRDKLYLLFRRGVRLIILFPIVLAGLAVLIGFDRFFIGFHELLFRDKTWLFDPRTDPIINVLTDQFFMWTFVFFAIIFLSFCGYFAYKGRLRK